MIKQKALENEKPWKWNQKPKINPDQFDQMFAFFMGQKSLVQERPMN